jgi:2-(3-amino-3-carboxypropyl)histidine synthase
MVDVLHIPCFSQADPIPVLKRNIRALKDYQRILVVSSVQHMNRLDDVASALNAQGKEASVGGQILGCNQDNAIKKDTDCVLYVGSGRFHPLGIALKTGLPVYVLNPLSQVLDSLSVDEVKRYMGRRKAALKRMLESEVFGVLVSTKEGQMNIEKAFEVKAFLEENGRKAYIISAQELSPQNILPFRVDCLVNTACPRMDADEYHRPIVNADVVLGFGRDFFLS